MSKFFMIGDRLINLDQVAVLDIDAKNLTLSFEVSGIKIKKKCVDEADFQEVHSLVVDELEIIDLGEKNKINYTYGSVGERTY